MSQYDLSNLYIKIGDLPKEVKVVDKFTELKVFKEFTECPDFIVRVAILSGDLDSPFVRNPDREIMIKAIFEEIGQSIRTEENKKIISEIIAYKHDQYMWAWLKYLEILNETDWTDLSLAQKDYAYFLSKANTKEENEDNDKALRRRNEIRRTIRDLGAEMKALQAKVFPDSKAAREAALAEQRKKIHLYAEKYAEPYSVI